MVIIIRMMTLLNYFFLLAAAGKKKYETFIRLCRKTQIIVRGGYPWDSQYAFHKVEMKVNDVTGTS